jgi:predicted RNA-binding Zn-ribbon protein involved in translation (DUF1610 family)
MFCVVFSEAPVLEEGAKLYCPQCKTWLATAKCDIYPHYLLGSENFESVWLPHQARRCPECDLMIWKNIFVDTNNWVKPSSGILEKGSEFYCPKCDTLLATVTYDICPGDPMASNNLSTVWVMGQQMDCPKCNKHIGWWIFSDINNWVRPKKRRAE